MSRLGYSGRIIPSFYTICIFNIQVQNLWSFQKFQCFLQLNLIYSLVYSNLSTTLLTFVKKGRFYKTPPNTFYRLVYSGNLFKAAGKILLFQGCFDAMTFLVKSSMFYISRCRIFIILDFLNKWHMASTRKLFNIQK